MTQHKVYCLLSGGIDSTTTLAIAREEFPDALIETVTVDYGQRHIKERESAEIQANLHGAQHSYMDGRGLMTGMLVDKGDDNEAIPEKSYAELDKGISPTYVSFRNGLMLSMLTAKAQSWVMEREKEFKAKFGTELSAHRKEPIAEATIYLGVHADDGVNWAYPDCTPEFIGAMANAIFIGSYQKVRLRAPLLHMSKIQVVAEGLKLGVDFSQTWSCYVGDTKHCGKCPTCLSRKEAFEMNGVQDPTEYE